MASDRSWAITDADVRSLAAKLKGLHVLLTPGEQALLRETLRRAAGRGEPVATDTEGFAWAVSFNPFTYLDAIEVEVRPEQRARRLSGARSSGRTDASRRIRDGGSQPPDREQRKEHGHGGYTDRHAGIEG